MLIFPAIKPVAFHLGPIAVHWYGLMYFLGFSSCWALLTTRARSRGFTLEQLSDIIFYAALGVIIGGRLGYMIFYDTLDLFYRPLLVFQVWKGGMSFHGGLLGVIIAMTYYAYQSGKTLVEITDFIAPVVPLGLAAGRIGNFINAELWGRVTTVPWAMVFPHGGDLPRHPSQLYEFLLEGIVLFCILWIYSKKLRPHYAVSGLFLVCYAIFRLVIEFFREPDVQVGYLALGWVTEGQILSLPMLVLGIFLLGFAYRGQKS